MSTGRFAGRTDSKIARLILRASSNAALLLLVAVAPVNPTRYYRVAISSASASVEQGAAVHKALWQEAQIDAFFWNCPEPQDPELSECLRDVYSHAEYIIVFFSKSYFTRKYPNDEWDIVKSAFGQRGRHVLMVTVDGAKPRGIDEGAIRLSETCGALCVVEHLKHMIKEGD